MISAKFIGLVIGGMVGIVSIPTVVEILGSNVGSTAAVVTPKTVETVTKKALLYNKNILRLNIPINRVVYLDEEVTGSSVNRVIASLKSIDSGIDKSPIYLLINSPGGEVLGGMQLISQIESMKSPLYTVCTGLCASMASFIHQYGVKRYALDRSFLMFHPASTGGMAGQVPNILSRVGAVQRSINKMFAYVAFKSHMSLEELQLKVAYEDWVDAEDSLQEGLVDELVSLPTIPSEDPNKSFNFNKIINSGF